MLHIISHAVMQSQTIKSHFTSTNVTTIWHSGKGVEPEECSFITWGSAKWYCHLGNHLGSFFTKLNILLPQDPAVTLLGIYPKKLRYVHTKPIHRCFILVLIKFIGVTLVNKIIQVSSVQFYNTSSAPFLVQKLDS